MRLTTHEDQVIETLDCERLRMVVIATDADGTQKQNPSLGDRKFSLATFPGAPENCPLTLEPTERKLGDFATCNTCIYSMIEVA